MNFQVRRDPAAQTLVHGWLLFAVSCAGIAGLLAFLVAIARTPALGWVIPNAQVFYLVLAGHVTFALIIWLLAFVVAVTVYFGVREGRGYNVRVGQVGLGAAALGAGMLLGSVLSGRGTPVLTDYVPVLETPLFFAGYLLFAAGIGVGLLNYLPAVLRRRHELSLSAFGLMIAVVCAVIAVAALVAALLTLVPRPGLGDSLYQLLFWGVGHVLQYVYVVAMVAAWYILAQAAFGDAPVPIPAGFPAVRREPEVLPVKKALARGAFMLYLLLALPAPLVYFAFNVSSAGSLRVPGIFLDAGLSLPTLLHLGLLAWAFWAGRRTGRLPSCRTVLGRPEGAALFISVTLYLVGAVLEPRAALGRGWAIIFCAR